MNIGYYEDNIYEGTALQKDIDKPRIACIMPVYVGDKDRVQYNCLDENLNNKEYIFLL